MAVLPATEQAFLDAQGFEGRVTIGGAVYTMDTNLISFKYSQSLGNETALFDKVTAGLLEVEIVALVSEIEDTINDKAVAIAEIRPRIFDESGDEYEWLKLCQCNVAAIDIHFLSNTATIYAYDQLYEPFITLPDIPAHIQIGFMEYLEELLTACNMQHGTLPASIQAIPYAYTQDSMFSTLVALMQAGMIFMACDKDNILQIIPWVTAVRTPTHSFDSSNLITIETDYTLARNSDTVSVTVSEYAAKVEEIASLETTTDISINPGKPIISLAYTYSAVPNVLADGNDTVINLQNTANLTTVYAYVADSYNNYAADQTATRAIQGYYMTQTSAAQLLSILQLNSQVPLRYTTMRPLPNPYLQLYESISVSNEYLPDRVTFINDISFEYNGALKQTIGVCVL